MHTTGIDANGAADVPSMAYDAVLAMAMESWWPKPRECQPTASQVDDIADASDEFCASGLQTLLIRSKRRRLIILGKATDAHKRPQHQD